MGRPAARPADRAWALDIRLPLCAPFSGGWASIYRDFARTLPGTLNPADVASSDLLLEGEAPLSLLDFLRPEVLLGFVASLVRYPAAFALKAPVPFAIFASLLYALDSTAGELDALAESSVLAGDLFSLPIAASIVFSSFTLGECIKDSNLRPRGIVRASSPARHRK